MITQQPRHCSTVLIRVAHTSSALKYYYKSIMLYDNTGNSERASGCYKYARDALGLGLHRKTWPEGKGRSCKGMDNIE